MVLERGRVGDRWLGQTWESLRLLTPNWASRLPGWSYHGPEPDGFMTAAEFACYLAGYARSFDAPVEEQCDVRSLRRTDGGFVVDTASAVWRAANVVIATGWCDKPHVPPFADRLPAGVSQLTPDAYRSPDGSPPVASWSSAGRRRESSSPTNCSGPVGRSSWPSAGTAGCPAATGGWTSGGGSTRPARSPSRSTRSPTRRRHGPRERCSSSVETITETWTCRRCSGSVCGWPAGWSVSTAPGSSSPERAVELKPDDPTINDHLGDAYAKTGRVLEAEFQWSHARDLKPEPEDLVKIKQKLASGLPEELSSTANAGKKKPDGG